MITRLLFTMTLLASGLAGMATSGASAPAAEDLVGRCLSEDWRFDQVGGRRVFRYIVKNTCRTRFRCVAHANIATPEGNSVGRAVLLVPLALAKTPSQVSHPFPVKDGATMTIQASKTCSVT